MARPRKSGGDDEGGGANWMDTYGDLVTLLLCFFVLLFAMSTIDQAKWDQIATSFSGVPVIQVIPMDVSEVMSKPISTIPTTVDNPEDTPAPTVSEPPETVDENFEMLYDNMQGYFEDNGIAAELIPDFDNSVLTMRFNDSVFFDSGQDDLLPGSTEILDKLIVLFEDNMEYIEFIDIQGHTDNVPINTAEFPNNFALSGDRAWSTLDYIMASGRIDGEKLKIGGYGEYHPVADNSTAEGRAQNRRVDFVIETLDGNITNAN
ncbi:MAG: flagellar motor protein MotB [Oscillospiraceae bacterium]|jgi:chemotaxis protein MotB|nr:flagellar motor protein MotB [Oscillospiraceae bacterium]